MINSGRSIDWNLGYMAFFADDKFDEAHSAEWKEGFNYAKEAEETGEWPDEA